MFVVLGFCHSVSKKHFAPIINTVLLFRPKGPRQCSDGVAKKVLSRFTLFFSNAAATYFRIDEQYPRNKEL